MVAVEARYHVTCRKNFENPFLVCTSGRPVKCDKQENFEKARIAMENDMELYTVSEFHKLMSEIGKESETEVYSVRMTHSKLKDRYSDALTLVTSQGRSNIILLDKVKIILCDNWYPQKKNNMKEESERVVKKAAQLTKNAIKEFKHKTESYPTVDDIASPENEFVPELLKVFIKELVESPMKETTITQTLFSSAWPHSVTPLNFGLAVSVDNCPGSKWMVNLLHKLGFSAIYNEVRCYTSKSFAKGNLAKIKLWNCEIVLIWIYDIFLK